MIPPEVLFGAAAPLPSPDDPAGFLLACHRRIEQRLAMMERAAASLESAPEQALAAFESAFAFLSTSGALHTEDEEASIFPRLRRHMEHGELVILASLEHDHAEAHRLGERLRRAVDEFRAGAAAAGEARRLAEEFAAHYRRHIAGEDETLIDLVRNRLTEEERRQAAGEMRARRRPQEHTRSAGPAPESRP